MITKQGIEIPDQMLIGISEGEWPIKLLYNDEADAASWLAEASGGLGRRHVYRVRLSPIEELTYVPPVPASLVSGPVEGLTCGG